MERAKLDTSPTASPKRQAPGIVTELTRRGIHRAAAERLAQEFPKMHIAGKITLFDSECEKGKPKRAGWLRKAIEDDYRLPEKPAISPLTAEQRKRINRRNEERECAKRKRDVLEEQTRVQRSVRLQRYLDDLPPSQLDALEEEAVTRAPALLKSRYRDSKSRSSNKAFEEYRRLILERHVLDDAKLA